MSRLAGVLPALLLPLAVACGATVHGGDDDGAADGGASDGATDDGASSDGASGDGSSDDGSSDDGSDDGGCTPCECGVNPPLCELGHAPAPGCDENGDWVCAPFECPALGSLVEAGDPCDVEGLLCQVEAGCGPISHIRCVDGRWANEGTRCSPEPECADHGDPDGCSAAGCRWLEPGCGDETIPSLPAAGCFDPAPCGESGCRFDDQACIQVMVQPDCIDCDACGQSDAVCLPSSAGG